jgi:myo-inositol-1(or 4)-monophosphatase
MASLDTSALAHELLAIAEGIAKKAGELLVVRPDVFDINQKSSARDFATQMDHASEAFIVESILALRPHDAIIGEEGGNTSGSSGITWIIDPIDGTVNYFYGHPGWNVSIAAKDSMGVLIGVVYSPTINSLWHGIRGEGAFLNGHPIHVTACTSLIDALVGTGFSYEVNQRREQALFVAKLIPKVRDIRRVGAAAVDLCMVASGALDGYFEASLKEWDLAAGGLIAQEAGAIVSGRLGGTPDNEMVIAAGPALHEILMREIG